MSKRRLLHWLLAGIVVFGIGSSSLVRAQGSQPTAATTGSTNDITFTPEISIPGIPDKDWVITPNSIGQYIRQIFVVFIWIVGVVAVVMVMFGGVKWVAAAGNPTRINDARETIDSAIIGVIIALVSVVLLNIINPAFTTLKGLDTSYIDQKSIDFINDISTSESAAGGVIVPCQNSKVSGSPSNACSGNDPTNPVTWPFTCTKNNQLNDWINSSANLYHVDASLIKSIILVETPPKPRGEDFVYSGPEGNNGPGYGLGQYKVPMVKDTLATANGGFPPQCTLSDLNAASGQRLPTTCREWLDKQTGPLYGHAGMEVQVRMIAVYLRTMLSDTKCIKGDLSLAAAAFNQGKGGIQGTFCNPKYLSRASEEDLARIKANALEYMARVAKVYPQVCQQATK